MRALALSIALLALVGLTVACLVVGNGDMTVALTPALVLAAVYAAWKLPLRWPLLVTTFLALTLENPSDQPACGQWKSPFYDIGAILLVHLNVTLPYKALLFSGFDVVLVYLFVVAAVRWLKGSRIDAGTECGGPMMWFAGLSVAGAAWMWVYGMASGDADVANSLWQVQRVVYLPALVFLFQLAFRGPADTIALGKVIVSAACLKAVLAIYIRATVAPPPGETTLSYATTHADSMLFAVAFCSVLAMLIHRRHNRVFWVAVVLPLLIAGMVANGRRLAWVELAAGVSTVVMFTPWSRTKRAAVRWAAFASPLFLAYAVAGWNSGSAAFAPVHTLRSVIDSKADPSTLWRDLENYNLFYTLRHHPLLGTGYGHGYVEIISLPDVSSAYSLYRFLPHNSILGLLGVRRPSSGSRPQGDARRGALSCSTVVQVCRGRRRSNGGSDGGVGHRGVPGLLLWGSRPRHVDERLYRRSRVCHRQQARGDDRRLAIIRARSRSGRTDRSREMGPGHSRG